MNYRFTLRQVDLLNKELQSVWLVIDMSVWLAHKLKSFPVLQLVGDGMRILYHNPSAQQLIIMVGRGRNEPDARKKDLVNNDADEPA